MKQLSKLLFSHFIPIFLGAIAFFTVLINSSDLLINIVRYIEREATFRQVMHVQLLYLPNCVVFALPVSLLFSIAFSMGSLYSNNELIAVFAGAVSLQRFILPLLIFGAVLSFGLFHFQDHIAIPALKEKIEYSELLLRNRSPNKNQSDISIQSEGGQTVYHVGFYDAGSNRLDEIIILLRNEELSLQEEIHANQASWDGEQWLLSDVTIISTNPTGELLIEERDEYSSPNINLPPQSFQGQYGDIEYMTTSQAWTYIDYLKKSGFPFRKELTSYYERYSFSFTPLIVTMISAGIGGSFRKNILAMSLLVSLGLSVVYYSIQMLSGLFASLGLLSSLTGAWLGTTLMAAGALIILYKAKS